jgi:hypothetical protein
MNGAKRRFPNPEVREGRKWISLSQQCPPKDKENRSRKLDNGA